MRGGGVAVVGGGCHQYCQWRGMGNKHVRIKLRCRRVTARWYDFVGVQLCVTSSHSYVRLQWQTAGYSGVIYRRQYYIHDYSGRQSGFLQLHVFFVGGAGERRGLTLLRLHSLQQIEGCVLSWEGDSVVWYAVFLHSVIPAQRWTLSV